MKPALHLMANTPVIQLRRGHAVRYSNEVCIVTATELKTPPRMTSYVQMTIRGLTSARVHNLRMTSNEGLESVNVVRDAHELSYKDSDGYHFIHPTTFEDVLVGEDICGDQKDYLIEGSSYQLVFCDDVIAAVDLPPSLVMVVAEAPEGVKGDSANNVYKAAVMETGLNVQVPLFIGPGEKINVKTEDGTYLSRAN
jgi:elongation factor P